MAGVAAAGLLEKPEEDDPSDIDQRSSKLPLDAGLAGAAVVVAVGPAAAGFEPKTEGAMMGWLENIGFCGATDVGVIYAGGRLAVKFIGGGEAVVAELSMPNNGCADIAGCCLAAVGTIPGTWPSCEGFGTMGAAANKGLLAGAGACAAVASWNPPKSSSSTEPCQC